MKRAIGYGLILLAASAVTTRHALASGNNDATGGTLFFIGGSSAAPSRGAQGYLGVDVRDVSAEQLSALKLKETRGAEIILVDHDAPAGKAGLREHDVVLQMNGQAIEGQDQIRRMLHESPPGKTIVLLVSRDGQQITVTTQMANREEVERHAWEQHITVPDPQASVSDNNGNGGSDSPAPAVHGNSFIGTMLMNPSYTGAMLEKMSTQQATYFGVPSGAGLLVRTVVPNSPAAIAGMQVCDVIIRANDHSVANTGDWAKAIKNSHGKPLTVVVLRDKKEQTLTLTPDSKKRSSLDRPTEDSVVIARLGLSWMPGF
ncbi:MAG TPA: PDZ domain-containing protein [Acidobacteriaceae bacterium]